MSTQTPPPTPTPPPPPTHRPLRAAAQRTGTGPIGWVGPVLAVLLTLLGLALLRDGVFAPGDASGWPADRPSWLASATTALDGLGRAPWVAGAGAGAALVGLYLLGVALRRRPRRALALSGASGAYLLVADVARRAGAAAGDVDGVLDASASATRRRVTVSVVTTGGDGARGVHDGVSAAVSRSLSALAAPPAVRVKTSSTRRTDEGDLA